MQSEKKTAIKDAKELAYLYDLYVTPLWREPFDQMLDDEIELPEKGKFLEAECGTGGYAMDLAARGGGNVEVIGVDSSEDRLELARAKATIAKAERVSFQQGSMTSLNFPDGEFDLAIGDATMLPAEQVGAAFKELHRVARNGATVALKLTTRGSFDELFSIYWEALFELSLTDYSPRLEELITERLTVSDAEALAAGAGFKPVKSVTKKERFDFPEAKVFFESPLIETIFLKDWLAILPDVETREKVKERIAKIIDRERHDMDFDVSIKATVIVGKK